MRHSPEVTPADCQGVKENLRRMTSYKLKPEEVGPPTHLSARALPTPRHPVPSPPHHPVPSLLTTP